MKISKMALIARNRAQMSQVVADSPRPGICADRVARRTRIFVNINNFQAEPRTQRKHWQRDDLWQRLWCTKTISREKFHA